MRRLLVWSCGVVLTAGLAVASAQTCRKVFATPQNSKQAITVSTTAVDIMQANTSRCSVLIQNTSTNPVMCTDFAVDGAPTTTTGTPIVGGGNLALGLEGQGRWQCIRSGGADATIIVSEGRP